MSAVHTLRRMGLNAAPLRPDGDFVLYWMIAARRATHNFALDRAVEFGRELNKPVLVFEPLRCNYPHASARLHRFVLDGMADNAQAFADSPIAYFAYVEPREGAGKGLLAALASRACVVVTDVYPCFFIPRMVAAAAKKLDVHMEAIDGNGLLPLRATHDAPVSAYAFRRIVQKNLPEHLWQRPKACAWHGVELPRFLGVATCVTERWPATLAFDASAIPAFLPSRHAPLAPRGGQRAGRALLERFVSRGLPNYLERNQPSAQAESGVSPYLHFGHISAHEVFDAVTRPHGFSPTQLQWAQGRREGFWQLPQAVEAFLDQLVTWRELGFVFSHHRPHDYDRYESLPDWSKTTLAQHADDAREALYSFEAFEAAATHDPLWNAAQRQLLETGTMHNYLRMLWGKNILAWSPTPQQALTTMLELNNTYALDGRDPNSYSGIFWCLGRFDRPFGPSRPVFGSVRLMTTRSTLRKLRLGDYLARWGDQRSLVG